jgi:hypothetical protein
MWDGWVNPEKHSLHIIGHWNYAQGVKKDIYVVSTADKVQLKVNGQSMGWGTKSDGFLFTFKNIEWKPGSISAVGFDVAGKLVCTGSIVTVGPPVGLRLTPVSRPTAFLADGHDLMLVEVEVVDANGVRCPTALNMIQYTLSGPAEWRGGMAMGADNYILAKTFPVEGGVNRFLVRSTTAPGTITIKASSEGLKDATLTLNTKKVVVNNGLNPALPSAGLPSRLERGPTPATPSFTTTRTALAIVGATAGAHADSAFASYDDNERTEWVNDGKMATAWIEYTLDHAATVNEITVKLNNFRSRAYPLRITVDGKEAYNGFTKTSLGYYTIKCLPQKGTRLRIQLTGGTRVQEASNEVEVNGKKLDDGVSRDDAQAKGTLSILEVEVYGGSE